MNAPTPTHQAEAARSLLERARQSDKQGVFTLLLDSAHRLDNTIDRAAEQKAWTENYLKRMYDEYTARPR